MEMRRIALNKMMVLWVLGICLAGLGSGIQVWAQNPAVNSTQPMHIEADKVVYSQNARQLDFVGQVHVVRPDFELWCDSLTAFLAPESGKTTAENSQGQAFGGTGNVRKIVAEDNVHLVMDQREATSNEAEYHAGKRILILRGNVELKEGKNRVHGNKVTFYLDDGRSEIVGSSHDRVKAVFFPEQDTKGK